MCEYPEYPQWTFRASWRRTGAGPAAAHGTATNKGSEQTTKQPNEQTNNPSPASAHRGGQPALERRRRRRRGTPDAQRRYSGPSRRTQGALPPRVLRVLRLHALAPIRRRARLGLGRVQEHNQTAPTERRGAPHGIVRVRGRGAGASQGGRGLGSRTAWGAGSLSAGAYYHCSLGG